MNHATYYLLDVFTQKKYGGNQLAIFPDAKFIDPELLPIIARELNLAETVFLYSEGDNQHRMRIFTPGGELPTAGHPTIGTAYYLAREMEHQSEGLQELVLHQPIGPIRTTIQYKHNQPELISMYQPLPKFGPIHDEQTDLMAEILDIPVHAIGPGPIQEVSCGNNFVFVQVNSKETLGQIKFNLASWHKLASDISDSMTMLYVFTLGDVVDGDVQGRMFAPDMGIPEDAATGSANGPLACYLHHYGMIDFPITSLQGYEMGRPSQLYLDIGVDQAGQINQVKVSGKCVFIGKGTLFLDFDS